MTSTDNLPYVEAELNYLGTTTERPRCERMSRIVPRTPIVASGVVIL